MSNNIDIEECKLNLKAIVTSNKGGVLLKHLELDYKNITGEKLPYKFFGYSSIEAFVESLGVFKLEKQGHDIIIKVLNNEKTQHLEEMIKKQKQKKKKKYKKRAKIMTTHTQNIKNYNANSTEPQNKKISNNFDFNKSISTSHTISSIKWQKNDDIKKKLLLHDVTCVVPNKVSNKNIDENKKDFFEKSYSKNQEYVSEPSILELNEKIIESYSDDSKVNNKNQMVKSTGFKINSSLHHFEHFNCKIAQLKLENKCKKLGTVTAVYNPSSIMILLDDCKNNNDFLEMQLELNHNNRDFINQKFTADNLTIGQHYTLYHNQNWHRILIECIDFDDSIICFFIDSGKVIRVHRNQIYPLNPKFYNIFGQAVECSLHNLKYFDNFPFINDILIDLLKDQKFILMPFNIMTPCAVVTLYDEKTKMNINDIIIKTFFEKSIPKPPSSTIFDAVEAEVLSIENGYWYLQQNKDFVKSLEELLSTDLFSAPYLINPKCINFENIYLATHKPNIKGRVKVMHFIDDSKVKVFFIDYGTYNIFEIKELIDLNRINLLVAQIPYQVVKVILHLFPPKEANDLTVNMFNKMFGENDRVSVLADENFYKDFPCVQLIESNKFTNTDVNTILFIRIRKLKKGAIV